MQTKADNGKLQILSQSNIEKLTNEVRRISFLYQAGRIRGIKAHEMLHGCTKDLNTLFWKISAVIGREHSAIDAIHKINNSGQVWPDGRGYLSKRTAEAIDAFLLASKLYRSGDEVTSYSLVKKAGQLARRLIRTDSKVLCQDIRDLLYTARKHSPTPEFEQEVIPEDVEMEDMKVRRVVQE